MSQGWFLIVVSLGYLCLLFAVAYWADLRADAGRSVVSTPWIYALSISVYCTSWTFYGSVGLATTSGVAFLPVYLGPTLMFVLGWFVLRKILSISKRQHITSIADFIASRHGKSHLLAGLVTIIAVLGIMPYIALQLKAVAASFNILFYPEGAPEPLLDAGQVPILLDKAFYVAIIMAAFSILFGTRHIDTTEHHEGMVAAIAFESIVKLVAFLAVGLFVTFGLFNGFGDIFTRAAETMDMSSVFTLSREQLSGGWITLMLLSMAAIICLPRQFQMTVVENVDQRHLQTALWMFPLYLFLINLFVLPIAAAGMILFADADVAADMYVLALPILAEMQWLAIFAFIGGLSAATAMVIVESVALSTMICNDLIMPVLLRMKFLRLAQRQDLSGLLIAIRRIGIVVVLGLGYMYFRLIGEAYALVTIGLVSFAAAAQFAPAMIGGIYWKGGTRKGALAGLSAGFLIWAYTLLLPSFALSGWLPLSFVEHGPWGISLLKPYALFGLEGMDQLSHSVFWSMLANVGLYVSVSLLGRQSMVERIQATLFVEDESSSVQQAAERVWRGSARMADLRTLAARFIGPERTEQSFQRYAQDNGIDLQRETVADIGMVRFTERLLAGAIGAASARVVVASVVHGEGVSLDEMLEILDEASHVIEYSRQLEQKSRALERATAELKQANERLKEVDRLKDEFLSTVTHELRTPLTSIRSFTEILHDNPELDSAQRQEFLAIIIKESERLTRLINQVLDLAKIESGRMVWQIEDVDLKEVVCEAVDSMRQTLRDRDVTLDLDLPDGLPTVKGDRDRLFQVVLNLMSNAERFVPEGRGRIRIALRERLDGLEVSVSDNGPGIAAADQQQIFDKFFQAGGPRTGNPSGTGLGLTICKRIIDHMDGRIWLESELGKGTTFAFVIPYAAEDAPAPDTTDA